MKHLARYSTTNRPIFPLLKVSQLFFVTILAAAVFGEMSGVEPEVATN